MWKYIIYWTLCQYVLAPCPEPVITETDKFGRTSKTSISFGCLVAHSKKECDGGHQQEFFNRDSAIAFYNEAKLSDHVFSSFYNNYIIENVRIDSVQITKTK